MGEKRVYSSFWGCTGEGLDLLAIWASCQLNDAHGTQAQARTHHRISQPQGERSKLLPVMEPREPSQEALDKEYT